MPRCAGCNRFYIGQTGDQVKNRMTVHRQNINNPQEAPLPMSRHIALCASSLSIKFLVAPFYKLPPFASKIMREEKERYFISKFKPELNALKFYMFVTLYIIMLICLSEYI